MNADTLARWRFRLRSLRGPVWGALACALAAVAIGPLLTDPLVEETARWQAQAQRLRATRSQPAADPRERAARQAQAFEASLPTGDAALAAVQDLHQLAQDHGVALASGEYRLIDEAAGRWQRYQITLPAQGGEMALRRWVADALNRWPSLSLDEWSLARERTEQAEVQSRLRWSFYLRPLAADADARVAQVRP